MAVFIVDKPLGVTSHDVVSRARKLLKTKRVGHAGTLDPLATGVLVVLTEDATKLSPFLTESDKTYLAWVSFGASTPTLDAEGPISERGDASRLIREEVKAALPPFLGLAEQLPPQYSAIKKGGVKGYEAARKGEDLALPPRPAGYRSIQLLDFATTRDALPQAFSPTERGWTLSEDGRTFDLPEPLAALPTALLSVEVQAGTYIRAFARDLGAALGVSAHLSGLVRTRAGRSKLEEAVDMEALPTARGQSKANALPYPLITLNEQEVTRVRQGQRLSLNLTERVGLTGEAGELVAVAEPKGDRFSLLRVWQ